MKPKETNFEDTKLIDELFESENFETSEEGAISPMPAPRKLSDHSKGLDLINFPEPELVKNSSMFESNEDLLGLSKLDKSVVNIVEEPKINITP